MGLKLQARRNIKFALNTPEFIQNLQGIANIFFPNQKIPDTLPHGDTLNYVFKKIHTKHLEPLRIIILQALLRKKCLEEQRLFNLYYAVAVDGTGCLTFSTQHCDHCLTRKNSSTGQTLYYHPVLEAKLVCPNGLAFSMATEFIENPEELKLEKQDCELKAFYRLADKLKAKFPQLRICLLLDALYAAEPVFQRCKQNHWRYLITFKPGKMSATYQEYEALKKITPEHKLVIKKKNGQQIFRWVNEIDYQDRSLNALECQDEHEDQTTLFVFLTNFEIDAQKIQSLTTYGRCRWKIENEGFNVQKNGGYGLEHAFSLNNNAMKNFYLLMQIAHIFNQLIEKGNLLAERIRKTIGSLRVLSKKLWASLTEKCIDLQRLKDLLQMRIQIRFDSS